jgi:hypothetical protein
VIDILALLFSVVLALIGAGLHARASPVLVVVITLMTWDTTVRQIAQADRYAVDARGEGPRTCSTSNQLRQLRTTGIAPDTTRAVHARAHAPTGRSALVAVVGKAGCCSIA